MTHLQQIAFTVVKREDRKTTAKMLAAKGLSTRDIAKITGWDQITIARDLRGEANASKSEANASPFKAIGHGRSGSELGGGCGAGVSRGRHRCAIR